MRVTLNDGTVLRGSYKEIVKFMEHMSLLEESNKHNNVLTTYDGREVEFEVPEFAMFPEREIKVNDRVAATEGIRTGRLFEFISSGSFGLVRNVMPHDEDDTMYEVVFVDCGSVKIAKVHERQMKLA